MKKGTFMPAMPVLLTGIICLLVAGSAPSPKPLKAGEDGRGPWWMRQTAVRRDGTMASLKTKSWWGKAQKLKVGESFIVDAAGEAKERMQVRRERFKVFWRGQDRKPRVGGGLIDVEAIVWVIDDDGDGSVAKGKSGDEHDDCYLADYDCDGTIDRMADYLDNDGDQVPDEMDLREYFDNGQLHFLMVRRGSRPRRKDVEGSRVRIRRRQLFRERSLRRQHPVHEQAERRRRDLVAELRVSFLFYDAGRRRLQRGGRARQRGAAEPTIPAQEPDYANSAPLPQMGEGVWRPKGVTNIRYSFDVDNLSGKEYPLHYDAGFNLVGAAPYDFHGMNAFQCRSGGRLRRRS